MDSKKLVRINKYLSEIGFCSRRNAEELINQKKILVNGELAKLGQKIHENDVILVNGKTINKIYEKKYYLLNKPKNTICSLKDNFKRKTIFDLINDKDYLFSIGRLDYDTTGVIIITNDGELSNKLTHPSYQIERIYHVIINQQLSKEDLLFLNNNKLLINNKISKQKIEHIKKNEYFVYLWEGSYHHVKKIFEHLNRNVIALDRVSFAGLKYGNLTQGSYRLLTKKEIENLKRYHS